MSLRPRRAAARESAPGPDRVRRRLARQPAPPIEQTIFSYSASPCGPIDDCASWLWPKRPHMIAFCTSGPRAALIAFIGEHSSTGVETAQTRISIFVIFAFQLVDAHLPRPLLLGKQMLRQQTLAHLGSPETVAAQHCQADASTIFGAQASQGSHPQLR